MVRVAIALSFGSLLAVTLAFAGAPTFARDATASHKQAAIGDRTAAAQPNRPRPTYAQEAEAYWQTITEKRRARMAKRRNGEAVVLEDYVLTQPPERPPGYVAPRRPRQPFMRIPGVADFLSNASQQFQFVPHRPQSETEFKQAYAKVAVAAGLTREQAVRIYAFETGGNGTYDVQAGLTSRKKGARPISPAMGYNQLLSTNTVGLLAEHGDNFVRTLEGNAEQLDGERRAAMERKIAAIRRMIAFSRTVPNRWHEHDKLAKTTQGGIGIHAAVLDRDIGPLLQTQKLLNSVIYARAKGYTEPLTAAELEMMNFTGDGSGFDMVTMPQEWRERVPTSNFFERGGYERNPIAKRTGVVAALFAAIDAKMDRASQQQGARELAEAF